MTAPHNHNGGPLLFERHPDDKMRFVQWDLDDWFDTIQRSKLKPNAIGIYQVLLCLIYKHMGALRDDDTYVASHCNCDVRTYRSVKSMLIEQDRIYIVDGFIYNDRALAEIAKFCATAARKRKAASEREAAKKAAEEAAEKAAQEAAAAGAGGPPSANFAAEFAAKVAQGLQQTLQQGLHNLGAGSAQEMRKTCSENPEKVNEINDGRTTAVVVPSHTSPRAVPQREREREREREKEEEKTPPLGPPLAADEVCVGGRVIANCETVRHPGFTLSIPSIAMQLVLANVGLSKNEADRVAREAAIAHALQWGAEIDRGRSPSVVVPNNPANFIRGSVARQLQNRAPPTQTAQDRKREDALREIAAISGKRS